MVPDDWLTKACWCGIGFSFFGLIFMLAVCIGGLIGTFVCSFF